MTGPRLLAALLGAGARCSDGSVQETCAAVAELAVLEARGEGWRRVEIARGDDLEQLHFVFVTGDDERVRLLTDYDAAGRKGGAMHIAVLDRSLTRVEHWSAPAPTYSGGFCAFEGTAYSYTTAGGFLTPLERERRRTCSSPCPFRIRSTLTRAANGGRLQVGPGRQSALAANPWCARQWGTWPAYRTAAPAPCDGLLRRAGSRNRLLRQQPTPCNSDCSTGTWWASRRVTWSSSWGPATSGRFPASRPTAPRLRGPRCSLLWPYPERASSRVNWS